MARLIAVLVLLLMLAPATMAEPARHALADHDWIGGIWHRLTAWISGVGAYLIPDGIRAEPNGIGACLIPSGIQAGGGTAGIGACEEVQADPGRTTAGIGACIIPNG